MNARYACVSPISPPISDIRYEKHSSDTIPIFDIENLGRDFPLSESQVHSFVDGLNPHSEAYMNSTPLLEFPYSDAKSLQVPLMGLLPLGNTASLPNRLHVKSNISELKTTL